MPNRARPLALLIVAVSVAGCLPAPYGLYYRPSYPDPAATVSQANCGGQAGPKTRLSLPGPDGVAFLIVADQHQEHKARIEITLPPLTRFRFTERRVDDLGPAASPIAVDARVSSAVTIPPDLPVDPAALAPSVPEVIAAQLTANPGEAIGQVDFPMGRIAGFAPTELVIEPPAVAGARPGPPIRLLPVSGTTFPEFREPGYAAQLAARVAACRLATPQQPCENIVRYDGNAYQHDDGQRTHRGRFWLTGTPPAQTLHHHLEIRIRTADAWRLTPPTLLVRDPASGQAHRLDFKQITVSWHYPIPLDTRIEARGGFSDPPTRIALDLAFVHRDAARYRVQLPPFELNGKTHRLHPIDFERRAFDAGLEPFNC